MIYEVLSKVLLSSKDVESKVVFLSELIEVAEGLQQQ